MANNQMQPTAGSAGFKMGSQSAAAADLCRWRGSVTSSSDAPHGLAPWECAIVGPSRCPGCVAAQFATARVVGGPDDRASRASRRTSFHSPVERARIARARTEPLVVRPDGLRHSATIRRPAERSRIVLRRPSADRDNVRVLGAAQNRIAAPTIGSTGAAGRAAFEINVGWPRPG